MRTLRTSPPPRVFSRQSPPRPSAVLLVTKRFGQSLSKKMKYDLRLGIEYGRRWGIEELGWGIDILGDRTGKGS